MKKNPTLTLLLLLIVNLLTVQSSFSQNIAINATGNLPDTSAMLDISSTTKGFLLPRMSTIQRTAIILPATGLIIFNTTSNIIEVNTGTSLIPIWSPLSVQGLIDTSSIPNFSIAVQSLTSAKAPITDTNGVIGITQSTASSDGYLSSTDWNTFNNKANPFTSGDLAETNSHILTVNGGTGAVLGAGATIEVSQSSNTQDGYLSSGDWNIFNNKPGSITLNSDNLLYSTNSFSVSGGAATGTPVLRTQVKNTFLAGPTTGGNVAPSFRTIIAADLPGAATYIQKTAAYTALSSDYTIDCTTNTFTVTLPTAAGIQGKIYVIKNTGTGTITVSTTSSQLIDGVATKVLSVRYSEVTVQSTGTGWIILSN